MAYLNDFNRGGYGKSGYNNSARGGSSKGYQQRELPKEIVPEKVPADYVDLAEKVMRQLMSPEGKKISTSKIRNLLSMVSDVYNAENLRTEKTLLDDSVVKLNLMRVRTAYECGRDNETKEFVQKAKLLEYLKGISAEREDMIRFAHYMEALVAYHRYFGGKEE